MNKQEAIESVKNTSYSVPIDSSMRYIREETAIKIINCIDEPEKPIVPRYIDTWIQGSEYNGFDLYEAMTDEATTDGEIPDKVATWIVCNPETFAKAWLYGYEVEKEKLYTVELPNPNGGTHLVLCKDCDGKLFVATFSGGDCWETFGKCKLTESEIKKDFEWAWQFAKEVNE